MGAKNLFSDRSLLITDEIIRREGLLRMTKGGCSVSKFENNVSNDTYIIELSFPMT